MPEILGEKRAIEVYTQTSRELHYTISPEYVEALIRRDALTIFGDVNPRFIEISYLDSINQSSFRVSYKQTAEVTMEQK